MGSNSRVKYGEGTSGSGVKRFEDDDNYEYDDEEQEMKFRPASELLLLHHSNGFADPLVQLPSLQHGLRAYHEPPPPLVMPQVPVVAAAAAAMQRPGGVVAQQQPGAAAIFMQQNGGGYVECVVHQRLKSVKIRWNHGGTNVAIAGSWDNWETTETLQKNVGGQYFVIVKTLPIGIYHYRYIVDGYFTHAPDFPSAPPDHSGYAYNILDLQDYIPQTFARLSESEDPPSPPSSYDNILLNDDEFNKPPPELPPQLPVTIRQQEEPSMSNSTGFVPKNTHLELNHLYIHKTDGEQFVALRSTHRFQHKYVTMVLYKSLLHRER